jgi:hypothetical protein
MLFSFAPTARKRSAMQDQVITREELAGIFEQVARSLRSRTVAAPDVDAPSSAHETSARPGENRRQPRGNTRGPVLRSWKKIGEFDGEKYAWPKQTEEYDPFEVWETDDTGHKLQFGLGYIAADPSTDYYGHPRGYWVAFEMVNRQKRRPIGVFIEGDDPSDVVAVIKGKGPGGRSMYAPGDELPAAYEDLTVDVFRHRIAGPQAYDRLAVIAKNADRQTMLNHAAIQSTLRN